MQELHQSLVYFAEIFNYILNKLLGGGGNLQKLLISILLDGGGEKMSSFLILSIEN